ncbi:MAG: response regulator [Deltaproteobacteria bacterium]|nr:MAG: response regulator [Deltaproteobacteria bacterium]
MIMKTRTVFIAYQDDLSARSLSTFFHGAGYRVERARAVSEMIRKVRKGNPGVTLLDEQLEGIEACDLVPLLKNIHSRMQIIVISSDETLDFVKRLREAGIFYHAMKPIDLAEIRCAAECAFEKIGREYPGDWGLSFLTSRLAPA